MCSCAFLLEVFFKQTMEIVCEMKSKHEKALLSSVKSPYWTCAKKAVLELGQALTMI